jgi:hypothetical protein
MFTSVNFTRNINYQLTEMLKNEIQNRTPYKVVGTPEQADAKLEGTITLVDKNLFVENPNNLPRQVQQMIQVNVRFTDIRSEESKDKSILVPVNDTAPFFPEIGETSQLGQYKTMQKMVGQIISMMEEPWEGRGLRPPVPKDDKP